jgi:hypothetical protein
MHDPDNLLGVSAMTKSTRWGWIGVCTFGIVALVCAQDAGAQDKKTHAKHDEAALYHALRDVINTGAKIFNEHGDHAGCYRLYQGSLISVRPFLAPDLQKNIDAGLIAAEKQHNFADRAFELRKVLDDIRAKSKPAGLVDPKDPRDPKGDKGQVTGKVTYEGKPLPGGFFITLVGGEGKKFSSALQKDGTFTFNTAIPTGEYRIAIEPIPGETIKSTLPKRYTSESTSGVSIRVQPGKQVVDLNLVN